MSFLRTTLQTTHHSLKIVGVMSNLVASATSKSTSYNSVLNKYNFSPLEAKLTALNEASLRKLVSQDLKPKCLRLPTSHKGINVSFYDPLINPVILEIPSVLNFLEKLDPLSSFKIEEPLNQDELVRKEAARLIVIRRRKMRRHKLRKLRKKMRFVWLKEIQKKEFIKEKNFQACQMEKIREAESFNAVKYVNEFIAKVKEVPEPRTWKGKKLPKEVIRILIANNGKYIPPKKS